MANKVGRPSSGKGKLITIRLTPKMRYSVELLARIQRRNSITAVIEFALEKLLHDKATGLFDGAEFLPDLVWDDDEAIRFVKLCLSRRDLLTYDEGLVWREIEMNKVYWKGDNIPDFEKIQLDWDEINKNAEFARA